MGILPKTDSSRPRVAVTLGDPRGIGPEVMPKAVQSVITDLPAERILLIGPEGMNPGLVPYHALASWDGTEAGAGRATVDAIRIAVEMCASGEVGGLVTGPSHKQALRAAGWDIPGQTELLRDLSGSHEVGMLMCAERTRIGGPLRVLLATTHIPLRDLFQHLTTDLLVGQGRLLSREIRDRWGIERPRLALCGVNPHAGDGGLFGSEEADLLVPAVRQLRADDLEILGPFPADTVFFQALQGRFDAVIAPYHDVGMAAFKSVTFGTGVNVTLGLPFIRTSPDHGTAFDIVGSGRADPSSSTEAIRLALSLLKRSFDTPIGPR